MPVFFRVTREKSSLKTRGSKLTFFNDYIWAFLKIKEVKKTLPRKVDDLNAIFKALLRLFTRPFPWGSRLDILDIRPADPDKVTLKEKTLVALKNGSFPVVPDFFNV
ncbi:MAG: hypothetical protein LBI10_03980 [Deltaproteobacteria bacterium]|nr:hypothetical protein [Deltaproteobacteria bacterium]